MSIQNASGLETDELCANQTRVDEMVVVEAATGIYNVANYEHGADNITEHTYTVTDDRGCTCPAATYHGGLCKHEEAVTVAKEAADDEPTERVTGPHAGVNAYGEVDHYFWICERCGVESTDRQTVEECC